MPPKDQNPAETDNGTLLLQESRSPTITFVAKYLKSVLTTNFLGAFFLITSYDILKYVIR